MKSRDKFTDIDNALKELQETISRLNDIDTAEIGRKVEVFRRELYEGISRWGSVELSRHAERPGIDEYIGSIFTEFTELRGDRVYEDDPAVIGGPAFLDDVPVMVVGHRKRSGGKKDYIRFHYGMASPSGHYKAIRLYRLAEKFARPIITFVDTPGAYPVPEAEDRGQAFSIARCIQTIAGVRTPVVACIIGEAGSGGALAFGFGDRIIMLENSFYSAISPEGFSSIIFKDPTKKEKAAETLRGSGRDLYAAGIVDYLVREPVGGAHNAPDQVIEDVGRAVRQYVNELVKIPVEEVLKARAAFIQRLVPSG
ncbi:MAG TPA: carboxyl transferase domain-containing protein [Deltaproteobacteria bacterium]|nr:carboxyl transferase domain-containing protein [Deltaproteobacteria bacterium]HPR54832.1 carboxyl transferase domain-containing protein [Deltaproteobacteria bacterium]HXK46543.1 carboxyl transferase domain-containing protein [Deltaproteobacteria bacterium]